MMEQTKSPDDYQTQNNYDMTILHLNMDDDIDEDEEENSIFATKTSTHQKKTIPQWARSKIETNLWKITPEFVHPFSSL